MAKRSTTKNTKQKQSRNFSKPSGKRRSNASKPPPARNGARKRSPQAIPRGVTPARPLYLKKLQVKNARCFKDIDVDFMRGDKPRMRTIIVGNNGSGKTSLLRAIAIGLCQQREASLLMGELAGDFVRRNKAGNYADKAIIRLEFLDPDDPSATVTTTTEVKRDTSGQETIHSSTTPENFPWHRVFAGGYGVNRGARHREVRQGYSRSDALRSLFSDDTPLLDPEGTLRAIKLADAERATEGNGDDTLLRATKLHLRQLLRLNPNHEIEVSARSVQVHGPWGTMPFHALGDGYRGTAGWVLDLLGMALAAGRLDDITTLRGVVLIDEIDEHLHPAWQRELLPLLTRRFKELQVVGTTHSAMTIVECESDDLIACKLSNAVASTFQNLRGPQGHSADDILRGEWFGLGSTLDSRTQKLLRKYEKAIADSKPESVVAPLREQLRDRLGRKFDSPIDELAIEIAAELRKQNRGRLSVAKRRALVKKGVARLKQRIAAKGLKRGQK